MPSESDRHLLSLYQQHINEGLARLIDFMGLSTEEVEAEGSIVRTADGRKFIDLLGGYGVFNLGHRHPRVVEAVRRQLERMPLSAKVFLNRPQAELAARLAEITPGELAKCFFCNSGTEAVEAAIKFSRLATGRSQVVYATGAFHGKTLGSLSATDRPHYRDPFMPLLEFRLVPYGDHAALEEAVGEDTACLLIEPIQGEGGIVIPPEGYLRACREACHRAGALLVLDEIQTGLGRTGRMFACEHEGVVPDLMCLAKALGGGVMPIGAVVATPRVWEKFEQNPLLHTSTFGGGELACAAALAAVEATVEEDLPAMAREKGAWLMERLRELAAAHPELVREVRGRGLMAGIEFARPDFGELFIASAISRGVLTAFTLNRTDVIRLEPPLNIPHDLLSEAVERLFQAMEEVGELVAGLTSSP